MCYFDDALTVGHALDEHLRIAGFTKETYGPWIPVILGPIRFRLPNPPWRQRTLILHDLHHVLTGYDTSFLGEAQVSAWEAKTGCRGLPPIGFAIIYGAMITGWFAGPNAVHRAWQRGRGSRNLFSSGFDPGLLSMNLGELRRKLGIQATPLFHQQQV